MSCSPHPRLEPIFLEYTHLLPLLSPSYLRLCPFDYYRIDRAAFLQVLFHFFVFFQLSFSTTGCTSSIMQPNTWTASLLSLPSDVTQQHIMRFLSRADLVVLSMTCTAMRKTFSKWMISFGREAIFKAVFRSELMDDLFRVGSFPQLVWFQKTLKCASKIELNQSEQILVAIRGDFFCKFVGSYSYNVIYLLRRKLRTSACFACGRLLTPQNML